MHSLTLKMGTTGVLINTLIHSEKWKLLGAGAALEIFDWGPRSGGLGAEVP